MIARDVLEFLNGLSDRDLDKPLNVVLVDEIDGIVTQSIYGLTTNLTTNKYSVVLDGFVVQPE